MGGGRRHRDKEAVMAMIRSKINGRVFGCYFDYCPLPADDSYSITPAYTMHGEEMAEWGYWGEERYIFCSAEHRDAFLARYGTYEDNWPPLQWTQPARSGRGAGEPALHGAPGRGINAGAVGVFDHEYSLLRPIETHPRDDARQARDQLANGERPPLWPPPSPMVH
jgi:hypothetical protein